MLGIPAIPCAAVGKLLSNFGGFFGLQIRRRVVRSWGPYHRAPRMSGLRFVEGSDVWVNFAIAVVEFALWSSAWCFLAIFSVNF